MAFTATKNIDVTEYVEGTTGTIVWDDVANKYYAVLSNPSEPVTQGPATLAFVSDENGEILDWTEVAGGANMTEQQVIDQLSTQGEQPNVFYGSLDPEQVQAASDRAMQEMLSSIFGDDANGAFDLLSDLDSDDDDTLDDNGAYLDAESDTTL